MPAVRHPSYPVKIWGGYGEARRVRHVGLTAGTHSETCRNSSVRRASPPISDEGGEDAFMALCGVASARPTV